MSPLSIVSTGSFRSSHVKWTRSVGNSWVDGIVSSSLVFGIRFSVTMSRRTLSLCIMARKPAPRVRAILEQFRPIVDEIVLAADGSGDPAILDQCADLADKRFALDPAPLNRRIGWLHAQCDCDWILRFDDDEAPSRKLLETLPDLISPPRADAVRNAAALALRIDGVLDLAVALDARLPVPPRPERPGRVAFPGASARSARGPRRLSLVDVPLYHSELLLAGVDERRAKRAEYEARRPDVRNGQFPTNGYYTPEDFGNVTKKRRLPRTSS